jgi:lipid II:glycine glycyltransferase (peptidoglycan interpeptide bridge formation enzyme)
MRLVSEVGAWDDIVRRMAAPHVLQGSVWGAHKAAWGWQVHAFAWGQSGYEAACAQVMVRRAGGLPLLVGYVPKGPLLADPYDTGMWATVLADLEAWARARRLAVLKIDPDLPVAATPVAGGWRRRGWFPSDEQVQYPNTMLSDLAAGQAGLLAAMKPKTRYNLRLAARRGVKILHAERTDLGTFFDLYAATARRNGFAIRARAYYLGAWGRFLDNDMATLVLAVRLGEVLAGVLPVAYGPTAWYLYGASADHGREHMPAYLAQWASLEWALERGCRSYDWWGGPTRLAEDDPLWGVYRFKDGFGARWVEQLGAWDFAPVPAFFRAYRAMGGLRRAALKARRGAQRLP